MKKTLALSTLAAATLLIGTSAGAFAQAPSPHAKTTTHVTGSGKDTGMEIPSGMSGNGPGGVGTIASRNATNPTTGKTGASKKKSASHSKKRSASKTSKSH